MLRTIKRKDGKSPYYYITGTIRVGRKVITINAESTGKVKKITYFKKVQRNKTKRFKV